MTLLQPFYQADGITQPKRRRRPGPRFSPPRIPKPYRERREDLLAQIERLDAMMKSCYRGMVECGERLAALDAETGQ